MAIVFFDTLGVGRYKWPKRQTNSYANNDVVKK